jgi:hypothetical protein
MGAPSKSRDTVRIEDLHQIRDALILMNAEGNLPPTNDGCITDNFLGDYLDGKAPIDPQFSAGNPPLKYADGKECNGYYWYEFDPGDSQNFEYGLFAIMENWNYANTICPPAISGGNLTYQEETPQGQQYCYAILTE